MMRWFGITLDISAELISGVVLTMISKKKLGTAVYKMIWTRIINSQSEVKIYIVMLG